MWRTALRVTRSAICSRHGRISITKSSITRALSDHKPFSRFSEQGELKVGELSEADKLDAHSFFLAEAECMIAEIHDAIFPMKATNPEFRIEQVTSDELVVYIGDRGSYTFRIDQSQEVIVVISPISGHHKYNFDPREGLWLGTADRHDMRGLITRDFLRHAIGFPQFTDTCRHEWSYTTSAAQQEGRPDSSAAPAAIMMVPAAMYGVLLPCSLSALVF